MLIVDVHAHMDLEDFSDVDRSSIIEEFIKLGGKAIVSNGVNAKSNRKIIELSKKYPIIKPALGIYPTHCLEMVESGKTKDLDLEVSFIEDCVKKKIAIAIGEVGLEYKEIELTEDRKKIMKESLLKFVNISKKYNVPIILHSRGAELELIEFLEEQGMKNKKVIMHCFCGRKHHVKRVIENGWFFSIPCTVTKLLQFQEIILNAPISQILTETDAPYLAPIRGDRNDSRNIVYSINKIAELKKMNEEEVANIIFNNYQRLFL